MTKRKREEEPKKFEVKKRAPKDKPNFFQNVTPFSHPVAEIFNFSGEESHSDAGQQNELRHHLNLPNKLIQHNSLYIPNLPNIANQLNEIPAPQQRKNYDEVADFIDQEDAPKKLFKGMSKNTYDALFLKTRGAASPVRKIRATKSDLMRWAGLSDVTIDKHLKHLKSVGLLKVDFIVGSHEGNWYEIFTPAEIYEADQHNQPGKPTQPNIAKLKGDVESVNPIGNKDAYGFAGISANTIENDNDALVDFAAALDDVSRKLTKKGLRENEKGNWKELADLLAMELEIAAARTDSIENVPAFLTEHLRGRLSQNLESVSNETRTGEKKIVQALQVGESNESLKSVAKNLEAKPLTERAKQILIKTMRGYIAKGEQNFILNLRDRYTVEDWQWLMDNLKASDNI